MLDEIKTICSCIIVEQLNKYKKKDITLHTCSFADAVKLECHFLDQ